MWIQDIFNSSRHLWKRPFQDWSSYLAKLSSHNINVSNICVLFGPADRISVQWIGWQNRVSNYRLLTLNKKNHIDRENSPRLCENVSRREGTEIWPALGCKLLFSGRRQTCWFSLITPHWVSCVRRHTCRKSSTNSRMKWKKMEKNQKHSLLKIAV